MIQKFKNNIILIKRILRNKICHFLHRPAYTKAQKEMFDNIKAGDIILANMPLSFSKLMKIEPSHRQRPYVVVKKTKTSLVVYSCSSNARFHGHEFLYMLGVDSYNLRKDTYVVMERYYHLQPEHLLLHVDHLSSQDICKINGKLRYINKDANKKLPLFHPSLTVEIGDIIKMNRNLYYVYGKEKGNIQLHKVSSLRSKHLVPVFVNGTYYNIDVKTTETQEIKRFHFNVIASCSEKQIQYIASLKTNKQQPQSQQQRQRKKNSNYLLRYSVGQNFEHKFTGDTYTYLYSVKQRDYFIELDQLFEDDFQIRSVDSKEMFSKDIVDSNTLDYILERLQEHDKGKNPITNSLREMILQQMPS